MNKPEGGAVVATAEVGEGVVLQYVEGGDASGLPVILLHGLTDSWRSFELVLPHIPRNIRAFALSLRGHGDSSRPQSGYRYSDFARDVAAFMEGAGLESAVIAGHSMGRVIAQRFALDHPHRAKGLVLIGAFAGDAKNPAIVELHQIVSKLTDPIDPGFVREFQLSTLAKEVPPEFLETVIRESLKVPAHVWRDAIAGILDDDVERELPGIVVPTLVISGDRDGFATPAEVERCAESIPGARHIVYAGAGHGLHWEEPARFASDLAEFAEGLR